jgi:hypothetical protein
MERQYGLALNGPAPQRGAKKPKIIITMHYRGYVWQIPFLLLIYMRAD